MAKLRYLLSQLRTRLWVKPALTGLGAVLWIEGAYLVSQHWRDEPWFEVDREVLLSLLQILASSMLTVAIFAVTAMVGAYSAVTTTATPRASRLVMQDRSSQNALASFLSAFIYAIVALVALSAIPYGATGRFALFVGYVLIVAWVLVSFVRWVDQVSKLGRVHDTIGRVERACRESLLTPSSSGSLGAHIAPADVPVSGWALKSQKAGYIQFVDMELLNTVAEENHMQFCLKVRPGSFSDVCRPLLLVEHGGNPDEETAQRMLSAFQVGDERHLETDPRFGFIMLSEIADRALSPGINDPGTAIAVIGCQVRLLQEWAGMDSARQEVKFDRLKIIPLQALDLMDDAFTAIARDGAGMVEVEIRLQKAFHSLHASGHPGLQAAARLHSELALEQALQKLPTTYHQKLVRELALASSHA